MHKIVSLYFLRSSPPYNAGETAGFPEWQANQYLAMEGIVQIVGAEVRHDPPATKVIKKAKARKKPSPAKKE